MATVIAGRFDTLQAAEQTANAIKHDTLIGQDDLATFYVTPPGQRHAFPIGGDHAVDPHAGHAHHGSVVGAAIGAGIGLAAFAAGPAAAAVAVGIGAYTGSLLGALRGLNTDTAEGKVESPKTEHDSGVMVAVRIDPASSQASADAMEAVVVGILAQHGAKDIEKAVGEIHEGEWVDFEPETPPKLIHPPS